MLVLSRKHGEAICIRDQIRVTVLRIEGNRVKLGFEAPHGVTIRRWELQASATQPIPDEAAGRPAVAPA